MFVDLGNVFKYSKGLAAPGLLLPGHRAFVLPSGKGNWKKPGQLFLRPPKVRDAQSHFFTTVLQKQGVLKQNEALRKKIHFFLAIGHICV